MRLSEVSRYLLRVLFSSEPLGLLPLILLSLETLDPLAVSGLRVGALNDPSNVRPLLASTTLAVGTLSGLVTCLLA